MKRSVISIATVMLAAAACSSSHGGDAGPELDAGGDAATTCAIECGPPPPGCHVEGEVTCDPPRCPAVVCEDGGTTCAPCPAPPTGCNYVDACTCMGLTCEDVSCGPGAPPLFPDFDRSCVSEMECILVRHTTDCCGSIRVMGIGASEEAHFVIAEAACVSMYPACGCASDQVTADDGTMSTGSSGEEPTLSCEAGTCTTSFAP